MSIVKHEPAEFLYQRPVSYMEQPNSFNSFWDYLNDEYPSVNTSSIESFLPRPNLVNYSGDLTLQAPAGKNKLVSRTVGVEDVTEVPNQAEFDAIRSLENGGTATVVGKYASFPFVTIAMQEFSVSTGSSSQGIGASGFAYLADKNQAVQNYGFAVNYQFYKVATFSGTWWLGVAGGCYQMGQEYRGSQTLTFDEEDNKWKLLAEDNTVEFRRVYRQSSGYNSNCPDPPEPSEYFPVNTLYDGFLFSNNNIGQVVTLSEPFSNEDYLQVGDMDVEDYASDPESQVITTPPRFDYGNMGTLGFHQPSFRRTIQSEYIPSEWEAFRVDNEFNTFHYRGDGIMFNFKEYNPRPLNKADRGRSAWMRIFPVFLGMEGTFRVRVFAWKRTAVWNFNNGQIGHSSANTYGDWEAFTLLDQTHTVDFDQMHCGDEVVITNLPDGNTGNNYQLEKGYEYYFGSSPLDNFIVGAGQDMPVLLVEKVSIP